MFIPKKDLHSTGKVSCGLGGVIPYFKNNDSIYITDTLNNFLKIYKENTQDKNIYNVDEYWDYKRVNNTDIYTFKINNDDLK